MQQQPETFLVDLVRYNNWANQQVLAICRDLTDVQLSTSASGAYGSIFDTFIHMIMAEADYVGRVTGSMPQPPFKRGDDVSVADLAAFNQQVGEALLDLVQRTPLEEIVHEEEDGLFMDYKARLLFMQAIIHGIEHRTNITTILNGMGVELPELDGWGYLFAHEEEYALKQGSL
jgi:uncharacterized damage-inducible protein DinB